MRELWDRFGPGVMIFVVAVGFLRVVWGREAFCGPETEQCFREWVSALGGWAAVVAAIPTVYYLAKQIGESQAQHKYNSWASRRPALALARATDVYIAKISGLLDAYDSTLKTIADDKELITFLDYTLKNMCAIFESDIFYRFETEIGHPVGLDSRFVHKGLLDMSRLVEPEITRFPVAPALIYQRKRTFEEYSVPLLREYATEMRELIAAFRAETNAIRQ